MKPILSSIPAFDAGTEKTITFSWSGPQSHSNRLLIRDARSLETVYDQTQQTMQLRHTLTAHTLKNGSSYLFQIQCLDVDGQAGSLSDALLVKCYTEPLFTFSSPARGENIVSSFLAASLNYSQAEGESLNECQIILCDKDKKELDRSPTFYDPEALFHTFSGLTDSTAYYVRARGVTVDKTELDTGYIPFYVNYIVPVTFGVINLENLPRDGQIKIESGIKAVSWESNRTEETFSYPEGTVIDLSGRGDYLSYVDGFRARGDFTLLVTLSGAASGSRPVLLGNAASPITLQVLADRDSGRWTVRMEAPGSIGSYVLFSDPFTLTAGQTLLIRLRRISGYYSMDTLTL